MGEDVGDVGNVTFPIYPTANAEKYKFPTESTARPTTTGSLFDVAAPLPSTAPTVAICPFPAIVVTI